MDIFVKYKKRRSNKLERPSFQNKVFTENPLLDEIVYNCRQLAMYTTLKDSDRADREETLESLKAGDMLIAVCQGRIEFDFFTYDRDFLETVGLPWNSDELDYYAANNDQIPTGYRSIIVTTAAQTYKENYIEYNNYYRALHGLPKYGGDDATWFGFWIDKNAVANDNLSTSIISAFPETSDYVLIHELDAAYVSLLYNSGIIDDFVSDRDRLATWGLTRDDAEYMLHLGERSIDFYTARVADRFQLLYCPSCDSSEVLKRFKELIEANRQYILYTVYSKAYKFRSDYYDNFMMVMILLQTFIDMIVELPEYLIRRDIFDSRTCQYIFESNGVRYFRDIPLIYQIALVKNLNKLIKYKSTDKCIVDIVSLFGFDNINVFKYYILKDRLAEKVYGPEGNDYNYYAYEKSQADIPVIYSGDDGTAGQVVINQASETLDFTLTQRGSDYVEDDINTAFIHNINTTVRDASQTMAINNTHQKEQTFIKGNEDDKNYDIKFIKVPILGEYDDHIRREANIYTYDTIAGTDAYWIGDKDYQTVKSAIKELEFTVLRSKYYSVEAIINVTEHSFMLVYFMNMLLYNDVDSSLLRVNLPNISTFRKFKLVDVIITLYTLAYLYYGVEPDIQDDVAKIAKILGFNMETDLATIATTLAEEHGGLTFEDLGIEGFAQPEDNKYMSFGYLEQLYFKNKKVYDHVKRMLIDPPNKKIYDAYKYIYDSLFIMDLNEKFLTKVNSETGERELYPTYLDYLRANDPTLYAWIQDTVLSVVNLDDRQTVIVNSIQSIVAYLKDYLEIDLDVLGIKGEKPISLNTVFSGLPSISFEFIRKYVSEVIDFFKSFKIFTHGGSLLYIFDDRLENYVHIIDDLLLKYLLDKSDVVHIEDYIADNHLTISPEERYELIDKVWLDISTWVYKKYHEFYESDKYKQYTDVIRDYKEHYSKYTVHDTSLEEKLAIDAIVKLLVTLEPMEEVKPEEKIAAMNNTHYFEDHYEEWMSDLILVYKSVYVYDDGVKLYDEEGNFISYSGVISDDYTMYTKIIDHVILQPIDHIMGNGVSKDLNTEYKLLDSCHLVITRGV